MTAPSGLTDEHYCAFGKIINYFARLEVILDAALTHALDMRITRAPLVMATLRYEQKRDLLLTLVTMTSWPQEIRDEFTRLIKEVNTVNTLRRYVAHSTSKRGRKPGHVKPMAIKAKGKVDILGMRHNEKEYSVADLEAAAARMADIGYRLQNFMSRHGMLAPSEETTR